MEKIVFLSFKNTIDDAGPWEWGHDNINILRNKPARQGRYLRVRRGVETWGTPQEKVCFVISRFHCNQGSRYRKSDSPET